MWIRRVPRGRSQLSGQHSFNGGRRLPLDVIADEDGYTVLANVPGLSAEDVKIELEDGILTMQAEPEAEVEETGRALWRERPTGAFSRRLQLQEAIDQESIEAWVEDGVLTVRLQKAAEARARKIEVQGR